MAQVTSVEELGGGHHVDPDMPLEAGTGLGLVLAGGETVVPAAWVGDAIRGLGVDPDEDEDEDDDEDDDDEDDDDDLDDDDLDEEDDDDEDE